MPYYDYDNSDDNDAGKKQSKYQQHPEPPTERKSTQMLTNAMRSRRAANIFNENYVTDTQNNGK